MSIQKTNELHKIPGLSEYVELVAFKKALQIPTDTVTEYQMLAQGEYNVNYLFRHPVSGKKLVLRVNMGSQMHLKHQIVYEYEALKLLESSGRTPRVFYADGSLRSLDQGVLVMEYLEGRPLDYHRELLLAADILADIHSMPVPKEHPLLSPRHPLKAVLEECCQMIQKFFDSPLGDTDVKKQIERMLKKGSQRLNEMGIYEGQRCCVNTELNNGNFLINGPGKENYLIDWEKPLYSDPAQDLGHFLAPTTTFWKTDVILNRTEMDVFIKRYMDQVDPKLKFLNLKERVDLYIPVTCLRGITWCAMAWVEYQEAGKKILNEFTWKKLNAYQEKAFLDRIEKQYLDV